VREKLARNGFSVERIKGYGRKRHMITGHAIADQITTKKTNIRQSNTAKKIAVIGAGLAGGAIIHALSQGNKTYDIDLIETHEKPAQGASGNPLGLINPKLTAVKTPHSDYYSSAYAHCLRSIKTMQDHDALCFQQIGSVHLASSDDKKRRFHGYCSALGWHKDHIEPLNTQQTQKIFAPQNQGAAAVFKNNMESLHYPDAALVSPAMLTQHYIQSAVNAPHINLNFLYNKSIQHTELTKENYDIIVICCADGAMQLSPLDELPINTVRGQISTLSKDAFDGHLECRKILCFGGYLTPYNHETNGYILGASFKPWDESKALKAQDDQENLERLNEQLNQQIESKHVKSLRASMRCSSKDRAPIIGRAEGLSGETDHIYLSLAHGSHGIISSSYAAAIIKAQLENRFIPATKTVLSAISLKRFFKDKN
jgi:tRNA 5-methylaminomethyl-2-thiouridine biosynthesis bifunctional protein